MTPNQRKALDEERNRQLFFAIEAVEGRLMSVAEAEPFMFILKERSRPRQEIVMWRQRPLLHFFWNEAGELKTLKLYEDPTKPKS